MSEINPDLLPVRLLPTQKKFEAGGHTYYVEHEARLSVARDRWLEKFNLYGLLGRDGSTIAREVKNAYQALNQGRPIDAGVILDNIQRGLTDLNAKEAPIYYICTLFINRENEDRKTYDQELAKQKILDWQGIERDFFLHWGLSYLTTTGQQLSTLMEAFSMQNLPDLTLETPPSDS